MFDFYLDMTRTVTLNPKKKREFDIGPDESGRVDRIFQVVLSGVDVEER